MRILSVLFVVFVVGLAGRTAALVAAAAAVGWLLRDLEQAIRDALKEHPYPRRKP